MILRLKLVLWERSFKFNIQSDAIENITKFDYDYEHNEW